MALWTSREADEATGGISTQPWEATGVSIDTRSLQPGDLFVALADQRDGHDFVAAALAKGASAALVTHRPSDVPEDAPLLVVGRALEALEALEDTATPQNLEEQLAGVPLPGLRSASPVRFSGRTLVLTQAAPGGILPELATGLLAGSYAAPSVWSAVVNEVPRLMICDGLPDETTSEALFHLGAPIWNEAQPR